MNISIYIVMKFVRIFMKIEDRSFPKGIVAKMRACGSVGRKPVKEVR